MEPKVKRKVTDASNSNAGDDFHVLWTVQKALELLNFDKDGLKAVSLEGLVTADMAYVDPDGDVCLGVDLTEYYSGDRFSSSKRLVISQLKYSTRHPKLEWTASRICAGKKGKPEGSIIDRLAILYSELLKKHKQADVEKKVKLKLVSNRPASLKLLTAISSFQLAIEVDSKLSINAALKKIGNTYEAEIFKIISCSKLKGHNLRAFLKALDFTDCNVDSRLDHRKNLLYAISSLGSYEAQKQYDSLHGIVWRKMMPEAKEQNTLKLSDIIYEFGLPELENMFPVPQKFESKSELILREQTDKIIQSIKSSTSGIICLHGGAGLGKSTIVNQIASKLDSNCHFLLFDCYGAGSYLDPEDRRHRHEKAFLQLSNELALKIGSPFLLNRSLSQDTYIDEFKKRLDLAIRAVKKNNPEGKICIIIDAADNSVNASIELKNDCFVHDLVRMKVPQGCCIVATCRTERIDSLNLPDHAEKIPLKPFSFEETSSLLQQNNMTLTDAEVEEFRKLTYSTPRVMAYVLEIPGDIKDKLKPLKPSGKSLPDIFKERVDTAIKRGGKIPVRDFLTHLIALPRPVPTSKLQRISGLSSSLFSDLKTDLWHGLILENDKFSFRDEDFENFLRLNYQLNARQREKIAKIFLQDADKDDYSSTHLGLALNNANKSEELEAIVIAKKHLKFPTDPIRNKEVFIERTRLAMKSSALKTSRLNFLKLQVIAAEANKTDKILESILTQNAELASAHGNILTNQKLYFQSGNPAWFGSVHFRSAAIYSRDENTIELAKEHLRKADAWLEYRRELPEEKLRDFDITRNDLAYGAEAILRVFGPRQCIHWLSKWKPRIFVFESIEILLKTLIETHEDSTKMHRWLKGQTLRIDIQLLITRLFFEHGLKSPVAIETILSNVNLLKRIQRKIKFSINQALISCCEYGFHDGHPFERIQHLLNCANITVPRYPPRFYESSFRDEPSDHHLVDLAFRKSIIEKYFNGANPQVKDFYPPKLIELLKDDKNQDDNLDDKRKFDLIYKHCLAIYDVRGIYLFNRLTNRERRKKLMAAVSAVKSDWDLSYRLQYQLNDMYRFLAVTLSQIVFYAHSSDIVQSIAKSFLIEGRKNTGLYLLLADRISSSKRLQPSVIELLALAEKEIDTATKSAREKIEQYTTASIVASRFSKSLGKHFFDKMINTSSEIDLDAHSQIKAFNTMLSPDAELGSPKLAFDFARYVEYCAEHLKGWDDFPWDEGVEGVAKLDVASALAIICRWDHRDVRSYEKHFIDILKVALTKNFFDHITVASLLTLNEYYWSGVIDLIRLILERFDSNSDHINKSIFVKQWFYDITVKPHSSRAGELLQPTYELVKDRKFLRTDLMDEVDSYLKSYNSLTRTKSDRTRKSIDRPIRKKADEQYKEHLAGIDPTKPDEIQSLFIKLAKLNENGHVNDSLVFRLLKNLVKPEKRCDYLTALCQLNTKLVSYYSFEQNVTELLMEWNLFPDVQVWKKENFQNVLRALFSHYTSHDYLDTRSINKLCEMFEVSHSDFAINLLEIIPEVLADLTSSVIYALFEFTSVGVTPHDKKKFLEWMVARWNENIKPEFGDGVFTQELTPPGDSGLVASRFIRYNLGQPDKRIRWKAAHAIRRFIEFGNSNVIGNLLKEQDNITCHQFQSKGLPFFWISSKLYFWIAVDRVSVDHPTRIHIYSKKIVKELFNEGLPHVLIKYFVKSTCVRLRSSMTNLFTNKESQAIDTTLVSSLKHIAGQSRKRAGFANRENRKTKFKFDTLDTLPYWYGPLGDIFGVSDDEVAKLADKYIHQYWGYSGDINKDNNYKQYDYGRRSNRHGTEPDIEDLQKYYEFHSMFCAASDLLLSRSIHESENNGADDAFSSWIEEWGIHWPDLWLSDLRDPKPLTERYWINNRISNRPEWQWGVQLDDFDKIVGLNGADHLRKEFLVVSGHDTIHYGKDYETSTISSALSSIETAPALVRALQTSIRHDFHIPFERDEDDFHGRESWAEERFKMMGWIRHLTSNRGSIDSTDGFYNDIGESRLALGEKFMEWSQAEVSKDFRYTYLKNESCKPISIFEAWSDVQEDHRYDDFSSSGNRLLIRRSYLLKFLKDINKCLVLCCDINRWPETNEFRNFYAESTLIYLIHPNGKVKTIIRGYQLR